MNRNNTICFFFCVAGLISCKDDSSRHDHSQMDMDAGKTGTADTSLTTVVLSPAQTVISSQPVVKPGFSSTAYSKPVPGYVSVDPGRNEKVAARFGGRIEKLYIRYDFQYVSKGEKIMEIYSPELKTAEEEYLYLLKNSTNSALAAVARNKLINMGLSIDQVLRLETKREITENITIYSPYEGYVKMTPEDQQVGMSGSMSVKSDMSSMSQPGQTAIAPQSSGVIREGGYIIKGQTLFLLNDFKKAWVILSSGGAAFPLHAPVRLSNEQWKDSIISGTIGLVEPVFSKGQKFTSYRVYLDNPGRALLLNSLVTAQVVSDAGEGMELPVSSVLSLGQRKIVWVRTGKTNEGSSVFEARTITTGAENGERIKITGGLTVQDEVALDAGFMTDSQTLINPK
ncbi:MAG: cusB [Bacteroidetes bacterium]|nr:MAG: cusB [Bacteroidota bacterium]